MLAHLVIVLLVGVVLGAPADNGLATAYEQAGDHFQGDIVLTDIQADAVESGRTALIGPQYMWPDRIVYYTIRAGDFSLSQITSIKQAVEQISLVSCIKFVERTNQKDYVLVTGENTGCWSYLGRRGNSQELNLQPVGCMSRGTIIHEFLHALGFVHMQSASDRDFYISVDWNNIQTGRSTNFDRYASSIINDFGIPYDYESVMHYGKTAFSKNGLPTIIPFDKTVNIGQRVGMSYKDIKRLNSLYTCN
ncbi:meprin A subunit beta [Culex quinquefasciatus]|uniref:Metalloendopeptidase n=1 Tax=Culex quinquefasciatus TaxID=7176 RepID=B0W772_CULQU|nr:meprin A subunit beta [Culex quinquefasciatus]|eukprot:XP_001844556.1 meprin A subunit beta [Culex quinquefasciatus]